MESLSQLDFGHSLYLCYIEIMGRNLKIYKISLFTYSTWSIPYCLLTPKRRQNTGKQENRKKKGRRGGLGEVWGKPGIRSSFTVHLGNIWMFDSGTFLLKSFALSTRHFDLFCDPKVILFTTKAPPKKLTTKSIHHHPMVNFMDHSVCDLN